MPFADELPTASVEFSELELGFLLSLLRASGPEKIWTDPMLRSLWVKLRSAAIAVGVEWRYGGPEDMTSPPPTPIWRTSC